MGRDDNRAVAGLQGGRAPARAFHDFMVRAVANRPAEPFETQVELPEWAVEPDEEVWFEAPQEGPLVDADGNPLPPRDPDAPPIAEPGPRSDEDEPRPDPDRLDQEWLDRAIERDRPPPRRETPKGKREPGTLPPLPGQRPSPNPDTVEKRPGTSQP
jgi:penicillin-binding protein 1A